MLGFGCGAVSAFTLFSLLNRPGTGCKAIVILPVSVVAGRSLRPFFFILAALVLLILGLDVQVHVENRRLRRRGELERRIREGSLEQAKAAASELNDPGRILEIAERRGDVELLRYALNELIPSNQYTYARLRFAVRSKDQSAILELCAKNPRLHLAKNPDQQGRSAIDLALSADDPALLDLLQKRCL